MDSAATRVSRRRLLVMAGAGGIAAAAAALLPRSFLNSLPYAADPPDDEVEASRQLVLQSSVVFLGVLFGRELHQADREELRERLAYTVEQEPPRLEDYTVLVRHLDRLAIHRGAGSFATANDATQSAVLDEVMRIHPRSLTARVMMRMSQASARHYRMRSATIPALSWLYANSGVAWRARGYRRWPGIPGNWRDVLAPGNPYP